MPGPAPRELTSETRRVAIAGGSIEVVDRGAGACVVMLPGLGGDASQLEDFARRVAAEGYRVVMVSPRGTAGSTGPLEGLTLHDFASDVAAIVRALALDRVHILGRAHGNRVARCFAADYPGLTRSVILVGAGGLHAPGMGPPAAARAVEPATDFRWRTWPLAVAAQRAANRATPRDEWWTAGEAPVLVIQGLDDSIAPPENGRALKADLGQRATLVEIPGAGHAVLLEKPCEVLAAVLPFLRAS